MTLEVGNINEVTYTVLESDTARFSGGETLPPVFSTPRLIGWLERTAHQLLLKTIHPGQTSVGTLVTLRHLAATPVGMQVRFRAEVLEIDRRRVRFKIEAWDAVEKIAEGEHERFIIDETRFIEKLNEKAKEIGG
jgi:fluoroacetyl-CoA thioesterase